MESPSQETADGPTGGSGARPAEPAAFDARRAAIRVALSLAAFFVLMALLAKLFGPQIEAAGRGFVGRFGIAGLVPGVIAADAFSLPPPPPFYVLIVATGTGSHYVGMTVISITSIAAGALGYRMAALISERPFFQRRIASTRARMDGLIQRYGVWAFAIASCTPLPYSLTCYVAGVYKVRPWLFALVLLLRIPKLLVIYWLIRAGWMTGSG